MYEKEVRPDVLPADGETDCLPEAFVRGKLEQHLQTGEPILSTVSGLDKAAYLRSRKTNQQPNTLMWHLMRQAHAPLIGGQCPDRKVKC
jgi:hypothetical protein